MRTEPPLLAPIFRSEGQARLLAVALLDGEAVYDACTRVEDVVQRPINPTILTRDEALAGSGFLASIRANPTVPVIGVPPWQ